MTMQEKALEGMSPGQRKDWAAQRLRELRDTPTEAQRRAAEEDILTEEIRRAETEEARRAVEAQRPQTREAIALYALAQRNIESRFAIAVAAAKEAAQTILGAEKALRDAQNALALEIEIGLHLRFERKSVGLPPYKVQELLGNLSLEASTEFRKRWRELCEEIGAAPLWGGTDPDDDPLANNLRRALEIYVSNEIGGRPAHFSTSGRTSGVSP